MWQQKPEKDESFQWDFYLPLVERFYHIDPWKLTFDQLLTHLNQLPRIKLYEMGKDPNGAKKPVEAMSQEEFLEAVLAGEIKPDQIQKPKRKLTDEEKKAEEARIMAMLKGGK